MHRLDLLVTLKPANAVAKSKIAVFSSYEHLPDLPGHVHCCRAILTSWQWQLAWQQKWLTMQRVSMQRTLYNISYGMHTKKSKQIFMHHVSLRSEFTLETYLVRRRPTMDSTVSTTNAAAVRSMKAIPSCSNWQLLMTLWWKWRCNEDCFAWRMWHWGMNGGVSFALHCLWCWAKD